MTAHDDGERDASTWFEPVGSQARWRKIYPLLVSAEVGGETISYQEFGDALDLHPLDDRAVIAAAVRRAGDELLSEFHHAIEVVPKIGYRVVEPSEHLKLAKVRNQRAGAQLDRGIKVVNGTDFNGLEAATRSALENMGKAFSEQREINRRQERTNARMERAMQATSKQTQMTAEEVEQLKEKLARMEAKLDARNAAKNAEG